MCRTAPAAWFGIRMRVLYDGFAVNQVRWEPSSLKRRAPCVSVSLHPYAELRKAGVKPRQRCPIFFITDGREAPMYRALYRKWRPQRFEDVVAQRGIVTALRNQVASGRVGHAYLFTGVRGTGKTTCAKIFCQGGQLPPPP